MKNKILFILLLFCSVGLSAQEYKSLVVEMRDGSSASFFLAEKPKITFEGELMNIVSSSADMEFVRSDVRKYSFIDAPTSVDDAVSAPEFVINGNTVVVSGISDGTIVTVYSVNGAAVLQSPAVNGECMLSLESLSSGLYIVNYNNTSIKFLKNEKDNYPFQPYAVSVRNGAGGCRHNVCLS